MPVLKPEIQIIKLSLIKVAKGPGVHAVEEWCSHNIGRYIYTWERQYSTPKSKTYNFVFGKKENAVLFKLAWADFLWND